MNQTMASYSSIFIAAFLFSFSSLVAQDTLEAFSLEEIGHVRMNPKSAGLLENKVYNSDHIYLGLILPYTVEKEHSLDVKKSVDLALEEINAAGGVLGKRIEVVAADDANINELTALYADSLIRTYKIAALIGPSSSRRLIYLAKEYLPQHPVLVISPSASSSEISYLKDDDLIWRTTPSDEQQARLAAHFIFNRLKKKSTGILYLRDPYGFGLLADFKKNFRGKVLSEVSYNPRIDTKTFDFTEMLNMLFRDKPESIYLIAGSEDAAIITQRIAKGKYLTKEYNPVIFSVDAVKGASFLKLCDKKVVEGMYGTALSSVNSGAFRNRYYTKYGKYPVSAYCEQYYDIAYILALAMEKSKSANYLSIRNELRSVTEGGEKIEAPDFALAKEKLNQQQDIYFAGTSGDLRFDANGDLVTALFEIWTIENGKFKTFEVVPSEKGQK